MDSFLDLLISLFDRGDLRYAFLLLGVALVFFLIKHVAGRIVDDIYAWAKEKFFRIFGKGKGKAAAEPAPHAPTLQSESGLMTVNDNKNQPASLPRQKDNDEGKGLIKTAKATYHLKVAFAQGDFAALYHATCKDGSKKGEQVVIKVATNQTDNDLLQNEVRILRILHEGAGEFTKHLPEVLDQFQTSRGQFGTVFRHIDAFDLHTVREKYKDGIPEKHIIWVFRRTLSILGYAHSRGVIHGNIEPPHILIRPHDHNVFLIDWSYAAFKPQETGERFRVYNEKYSAPEVAEKKLPIPASDLYSLGKCMIYLLGGNTDTSTMPDNVDERLQRFIKFFVRSSAVQRAQDAWKHYTELDQLREELFGPHKFIEFHM